MPNRVAAEVFDFKRRCLLVSAYRPRNARRRIRFSRDEQGSLGAAFRSVPIRSNPWLLTLQRF